MRHQLFSIAVLLIMLGQHALAADSLDQSRRIITQTNEQLQSSQKTIDKTDEQIARLLSEYKALHKEIANYRIYNRQLREIVASQTEEMHLLTEEIEKIEATDIQIMPFMQQMIDGLAQFIASDAPFLPAERRMRIERLNANMKRADIGIASKFRQILEAYQVEIDYGNTMEAYEGDLEDRKVVFLKIGRVGFYYLSLDKQRCAAWDSAQRKWHLLEDMDYTLSIAKAIKIAKKQRAPDLFFAAVPRAEARQ
jgi:chorismate mutase